jgi:small-conductance mechanosensitive channel
VLSNVLGTISIITGILWLIKPEGLKNRLKRKLNRKLRYMVYGFIVMFGTLMIGSVIRLHGLLPKIVGTIGIIIVIKATLLITPKASEKMQDWLADRPVVFFRMWALAILIMGVMLVAA